jgi:Flp pilus assembly pilin Flp
MANLTLLRMHHNWTGWGEGLLFLAATSYFLIAYIESQYTMFPVVYKFWEESVSSPSAWYGAILSICSLCTVDYIVMRTIKLKWNFINPAFKTNLFIDLRPKEEHLVEQVKSEVKNAVKSKFTKIRKMSDIEKRIKSDSEVNLQKTTIN